MTTPSLPDALRALTANLRELAPNLIGPQEVAYRYCADRIDAVADEHGPALEALLRERDELQNALHDLHALVWGECPSLLNEDSGGSAHLDLRIHKLIGPKP